MKIIACHLLNDYSGSPKVLAQLIRGWQKNAITVELITSRDKEGFLSELNGIKRRNLWYKWAENRYSRLFNFTLSQIHLFFKVLLLAKKHDVVYINTVLPFGAALAGKVKGATVVYHIHETTVQPKSLKKMLFGVVRRTAAEVIFVSHYLYKQEKIPQAVAHVLHNTLEEQFRKNIQLKPIAERTFKNVLMICSLKAYKGVWEFLSLANKNEHLNFTLVVNASVAEITLFFGQHYIPSNLTIIPTQTDTHAFYHSADVVLNLSRPDQWVETFGLTVLEAMAYGLPTIVPPVGGVIELVTQGYNGELIDSRNGDELSEKLNKLLSDRVLYESYSNAALQKSKLFVELNFVQHSVAIIKSLNQN